MKTLGAIAVIITGALLLYASEDFPAWGDPHSPASQYRVSQHYILKTFEETSVPNMVTAILADYRGYDTLFETVVIFTAGIAIIAILRGPIDKRVRLRLASEKKLRESNLILAQTCRLLVPIIQLFALYVIAHGHHSPGGGFQGGVIFGGSLILLAISFQLQTALDRVSEKKAILLAGVGVLIYSGIGLVCLLLGGNFLDYSILHNLLQVDPITARSHGILGVEIGVAFTVASIMFAIYANLSSRGRMKGGL